MGCLVGVPSQSLCISGRKTHRLLQFNPFVFLAIFLKACYTSFSFRKYGHSDGAGAGFRRYFFETNT